MLASQGKVAPHGGFLFCCCALSADLPLFTAACSKTEAGFHDLAVTIGTGFSEERDSWMVAVVACLLWFTFCSGRTSYEHVAVVLPELIGRDSEEMQTQIDDNTQDAYIHVLDVPDGLETYTESGCNSSAAAEDTLESSEQACLLSENVGKETSGTGFDVEPLTDKGWPDLSEDQQAAFENDMDFCLQGIEGTIRQRLRIGSWRFFHAEVP